MNIYKLVTIMNIGYLKYSLSTNSSFEFKSKVNVIIVK